ncbi:hypothetical protein LPJ61_005992, partial [Coemansia biformis]
MDVYGTGTLSLWCLGWAQDVCTRGTVLGAPAPAAAAIAAWRVLPRTVRRIEDAQHSAACLCGSDNRHWIGPLAVALLCTQALAQAGALWVLLARRHGRSLGRRLAATFWPELAVQAVLNPACVALDYAQPLLMQRLLRFVAAHVEDPSGGLRYRLALAAAMLAVSVAETVVDGQQMWHARLLGSGLCNVLAVLLGGKTLRRRGYGAGGGGDAGDGANSAMSEGRMHSVLTADLARMTHIASLVASALLLPVRLLAGAWYMYRLLGPAGVLGTALVGLAVHLTRRLVARARRIEAELGALSDRRLALIGEVVRGIAAVKLFGWGPRFVCAIGDRRAAQLRVLWARARVWSLINLCTQGALPLAMFAALAA